MPTLRRAFLLAALPLLAAALWPLADARGEVYLLGPLLGGGSPAAGADAETLYSGEVEVNGVAGTLSVRRSEDDYEALLAKFRAAKGRLAEGRGMFRFTADDKGILKRLLVLRGAARAKTVIFELTLPCTPPANPAWPRELPEPPPGAKNFEVIRFPSGGVFGCCAVNGTSPEARLRTYSARARADGWSAVGAESASSIGGHADLFVRSSPRSILWMSFSDSTAMFFRRDGVSDR